MQPPVQAKGAAPAGFLTKAAGSKPNSFYGYKHSKSFDLCIQVQWVTWKFV